MRQEHHPISWLHRTFGIRGAFVANISWFSLDTALQAIAGLIVAVGVARLLGPDALGMWTYAMTLYSVALVASSLGTDQIVVLDIVEAKMRARSVIATATMVRFAASIIAAAVMLCVAYTRAAHEPDAALLLAVLALAVPIMSADASRLWFRAHSRFQIPAIATIATTILGSVAKVVLVAATGSLLYAGVVHVVQVTALQVALLTLLITAAGGFALSDVDLTYAKALLRASLPLLLADFAIFIYARANILLLDGLRGTTEVGIFSAAARISEALYLLPMVVTTVASPPMYRLFKENRPLFLLRFDQLLVAMTVATVILCSLIGIFSDRLVLLLFGPNFGQSAFVLVIQVWTALFVAQGTVSTIWLLAEKATTIVFVRTFAGAVVSILLGLALIPQLGAAGAAIATLAAMASSSMIVLLFSGPIGREILAHQLGALVLMPVWRAKYSGT